MKIMSSDNCAWCGGNRYHGNEEVWGYVAAKITHNKINEKCIDKGLVSTDQMNH